MVSLVKRCDVLVTLDSAAMHIAAAVGTPFVALFGPTDPKRHVPLGSKNIIIRKDGICPPCYDPVCKKENECMLSISAEEVIEAISKFIKAPRKSGEKVKR
jgi:ADP-heptose:LPS heptosyltransferase